MYWKWVRKQRSPWALIDNPYLRIGTADFEAREDAFEERFFDEVPRSFSDVSSIASFDTVNERACVDHVRLLRPDVVVSFGTGKIRKRMLATRALKLNVHRGILPKYRGLDSDLWALYFGDFDNVGVTIHTLEPELDTGGIVRQKRLALEPGMEPHQMRYYTTVIATDLVADVVGGLGRGVAPAVEAQDLSLGQYYSFLPVIKRRAALRQFDWFMKELAFHAG